MSYFLFIISVLAASAVFVFFIIKKNHNPKQDKLYKLTISFLIILAGIFLMYESFINIKAAFHIRTWHKVEAEVISSSVQGDRAYSPLVIYKYTVDSKSYIDTTDLNVPMFGGKWKKYNVAETETHQYPIGKTFPIYCNPSNPHETYLHATPHWSEFGKTGFGATLIILGIVILGGMMKKKHH